MKTALMLTALMFCTGMAAAETAGELASDCKSAVADKIIIAKEAVDAGYCMGYVDGWVQGVNGLAVQIDDKFRLIQFDNNITTGQVIRVLIAYVAKHPEFENKGADPTLVRALNEAGLVILTDIKVPPTVREQ